MTIRANPHPFLRALPWALAATAALTALGHWAVPADPVSYTMGRQLVPAFAGFLAAALGARSADQRWPSWRYPLIALGVAGALGILLNLSDIRDRADTLRAERDAPDMAAFLGTQGDWTRLEARDTELAQQKTTIAEEFDVQVTGAFYEHREWPGVVLQFVGINGNPDGSSAADAARDMMAGAGVTTTQSFDTGGDLPGALRCGAGSSGGESYTMCAVTTDGSLAALTWVGEAPPTAEQGAVLAREFVPLTYQ
ncbi:hypothetical protein NODU109028_11070 [Nocardioides dubius]|uniref:Uncharacterized protein n=1 Tax=Nocardioides dubius TaxID=317019 RepID=A0ABP4ED78_9ACTN